MTNTVADGQGEVDTDDSFDQEPGRTVDSEEWEAVLQDVNAKAKKRKAEQTQAQSTGPKRIQRHSLLQERKSRGPPPASALTPSPWQALSLSNQQEDDRQELERLRRQNARLQQELSEYHPDSSFRNRYEDLARGRNSLPAEPGIEASLLKGVWDDQPVRDDGHLELGMMNFRYTSISS